MDPKMGKWIIEFLARQTVDDRTLNELVAKLPLPPDDFDLKRTLLLRSIQSKFSSGDVSERLLYLMEVMAELEFREGKVASESLKEAYCNVAVDCTVRFLEKDLEDNGKYFDTFKRIWPVRVSALEKLENYGLVSEKLLKWKDDLEAAVCDLELHGKILSRNTWQDTLDAVGSYIAEAWRDMGPSFIESSALIEMGNIGDGVEHVERSETVDNAALRPLPEDSMLLSSECYTDSDSEYPVPSELLDVPVRETSENQVSEVVDSAFVPNDGMVGEGMEGVQLSEIVGNAVLLLPDKSIVYNNESGIDGDGSRARSSDLHEELMDVTEENRVFEVVTASVLNDGMIYGGGSAVDGANSRGKDRIGNDTSGEEPQRDNYLSETQGIAAMSINEINIVNNPAGNQGGNLVMLGSEQSFLPHGTSVTGIRSETGKGVRVRYKRSALRSRVKLHRPAAPAKIADLEEMDEHISEVFRVQEGLGSGNKQPLADTLCMENAKSTGVEGQNIHAAVESPRGKRREQPVNSPAINAAANRREELGKASSGASLKQPHLLSPKMKKSKRQFWTPLEEDTLRTGVKKFGKGNWKLILNAYSDAFQGRTEVDLKDKWRNMVR